MPKGVAVQDYVSNRFAIRNDITTSWTCTVGLGTIVLVRNNN